jgi:hypothetical protein
MFPSFGFSIQEFFICYFWCKKWPLYVNFSIPPCGNWWFFQGSTPHVGMRFCGHIPNSPRNKNPNRHISYLLEKVVFLDPKRLVSPWVGAEKTISSTLNVMISKMVRNEIVWFGRHVDIEVNYKILWLEVPKLVPILYYPPCFQKGLFGGSFDQEHPSSFRG